MRMVMTEHRDKNRRRIGVRLIQSGLCTRQDLIDALDAQYALHLQGTYRPLGEILVEKKVVSEADLEKVLREIQAETLSRVGLFSSFSADDLITLLSKAQTLCVPEGALLFQEGQRGDGYYIIVEGNVRIYRQSQDGREVDLKVLGPDEGFGETQFLEDEIRTTSVRAIGSTHLIKIPTTEFQTLLHSHQEVLTRLIRIFSSRLHESNLRMTGDVSRETHSSRILQRAAITSTWDGTEQARYFEPIQKQVDVIAGSGESCFVFAEQGCDFNGMVKLLHNRSTRRDGPLLRVQADLDPDLGIKAAERGGDEEGQLRALFGSMDETGSAVLGLVSMADQGTLFIDGIESLNRAVQARLATLLSSGTFVLPGSHVECASSVRIIASCHHDPASLVARGILDQKLFEQLNPDPLKIPPLRKRKKDLKHLVEDVIHKANRRLGKSVQGLSQDAYQKIMAYEWPGNLEELETTILRGVSQCSDTILTSQDIILGLTTIQGKWSFNLLQHRPLKRLLQNRWYPHALQIGTGLGFLGVLLLAFVGGLPSRNLSLHLTWGLWEPLAVFMVLILGRVWCAFCPVGGLSHLLSTRFSFQLEVPAFMRRKAPFLSAAAIGIIIWAEVTWNLFSSPEGTALLLLVFTLLALVLGLFFRKRAWCRYVCPLGALLGLLARCSCTEFRSNQSICNNDCKEHPCVGRNSQHGCPMLEAPFALQSNQNCIVCGECIKECPEDSPRLNFRIPGFELGVVRYPTQVMNVLVPLVLGTQLFRGLFRLEPVHQLPTFPLGWAVSLVGLLVCVLMAAGGIAWAASRLFGTLVKDDIKKSQLLNYALVPLLLAYELGFHMEMFLKQGGLILPELGTMLGLSLEDPTFFVSPEAISTLQVLLILGGFAWSAALVNQIAKRHQYSGQGLTLLQRWPVKALTSVSLAMLLIS